MFVVSPVRLTSLHALRTVIVCHLRRALPTVRGDIPKGSAETFFRKVKFWKGDAPPIFVRSWRAQSSALALAPRSQCTAPSQNVDGVNYLFVKKNGLFFVCTTKVCG
jgi:hypothetical protein